MLYAMGWKYEGSGQGVIKGETERDNWKGESIRMTAPNTPSSRAYVARTDHLQARFLVEALGHQFTHKTFNLQFVLLMRCAGVMVAQRLWQWLNKGWSSLRPMPQE